MSLVGVQKSAVLTRYESLERKLTGHSAHGLPCKHLAVECEIGSHGQLVLDYLTDFAYVDRCEVSTLCYSLNLFHCDKWILVGSYEFVTKIVIIFEI